MKKILFIVLLLVCVGSVNSAIVRITSVPHTFTAGEFSTGWDTVLFDVGVYQNIIDTVVNGTDSLLDSVFYITSSSGIFSFSTGITDTIQKVLFLWNDSVAFNTGNSNNVTAANFNLTHFWASPDILDSLIWKSPDGGKRGCLITGSTDTTVFGSKLVNMTSVINSEIRGIDFRILNGYSSAATGGYLARLFQGGGTYEFYNNRIVACTLFYNITTSDSRCAYANCAIDFERVIDVRDAFTYWRYSCGASDYIFLDTLSRGGTNFQYNIKIDSCWMKTTGIGILVGGMTPNSMPTCSGADTSRTAYKAGDVWSGNRAAKAIIRDNTLIGDKRSDTFFVASNPLTPNVCYNTANSYQIFFQSNLGSDAINNTILFDSSYGGCRGIMIENAGGTASDPLDIDSNTIHTSEGYDIYYGEVEQHGIRIRYGDTDLNNAMHRRIRWNDIYVYTDSGSATDGTDYRTNGGTGIRYGGFAGGINAYPSYDTIMYNRVYAYAVDSSEATTNISFMIEQNSYDSTTYIAFNRFESDSRPFSAGAVSGTANPLQDTASVLTSDTLVRRSPYLSDFSPISLGAGSNPYTVVDLHMIDGYYLDGATDTTVSFSGGVSGLREIYFDRNLDIYVFDDAIPVASCSVYVYDNTGDTSVIGDTVAFGVTDANGLVEVLVNYYYRSKTVSETETDYNDFIFKAQKATSDTAKSHTVTYLADGGNDTIYFTAPTLPDAPVADFSGTPTSGTVSLEVTFTDASTNTPTSWSWNFGDEATSTSQNPTHTYTSAGTYTVTLTATNAGGSDQEIKTDYITVSEAPAGSQTLKIGNVYLRKIKR